MAEPTRHGGLTFEEWMVRVDEEIGRKLTGFTSEDLIDFDYWLSWDSGLSPKDTAYNSLAACSKEFGVEIL